MTGLDWGHAFATITARPAPALGMDKQIGSLRPGVNSQDALVGDAAQHDSVMLTKFARRSALGARELPVE